MVGVDDNEEKKKEKAAKPLYDLTINPTVQLLMSADAANKSKSRQRFEQLWLSEVQRTHREKEAERVRRKSNFVLSLRPMPTLTAVGTNLETLNEEGRNLSDKKGKGGSSPSSPSAARERKGIFRGKGHLKSELKKEHVSKSYLATYWRGGVSVNLRDIQRLKECLNEQEFKVSQLPHVAERPSTYRFLSLPALSHSRMRCAALFL